MIGKVATVAAVGLLFAARTGCDRVVPRLSGPAATETSAAPKPPATKIQVGRPVRGTARRVLEQPAQIEADQEVAIRAMIDGYVQDVEADIGDQVRKGEVLARLVVPELLAEREQKRALQEHAVAQTVQAKAAIAMAEAALNTATAKAEETVAGVRRTEADLSRWESELRRVEQLVKESVSTAGLLDETRNKHRSAVAAAEEIRARIKSADASVAEARAGLDKAKADVVASIAREAVAQAEAKRLDSLLAYAEIRAPFAGTVVKRSVDAGRLARSGNEAEPLFVLMKSDTVRAVIHAPELEATRVKPGQAVKVQAQAIEGGEFRGKVTRTAWALDVASRTLRLEIDLPNKDGRLRPGLYAKATITIEELPNVLTIPASAVLSDSVGKYCFVAKDGKIVKTPIVIGLSDGRVSEARSGLSTEDRIALTPGTLTIGQAVEVVETSPPAVKP